MGRYLIVFVWLFTSCKSGKELPLLFGQPYPGAVPTVFAPDVISVKNRLEHGLSFTADMKELAFGILDAQNYQGKIYYANKLEGKWTEPVLFKPLKGDNAFLPYFSPNGQYLLYAKGEFDDFNFKTDIWLLEKEKGVWSNPQLLGAPINSASREANACMTYDNTIYFSSNRNGEQNEKSFGADLFFSTFEQGGYRKANKIAEISTLDDEESIFVSPDKEYMIFCRYADDVGGADLYISYPDVNNTWSKAQKVDPAINTADWERRPFVSADNQFLFFTRLQIRDEAIVESDIFWVNTSKLFKPYVYNPIADITVQSGKPFEITMVQDCFKHINDKDLTYEVQHQAGSWLHFDADKRILSADAAPLGQFEITFMAIDKHLNKSQHRFKLNVR